MRESVKAELELEFAGLKTTTVASSDSLANSVAQKVGDKKAKRRGVQYQSRILGIDQTAGKPYKHRSKGTNSAQGERSLKVKKS